MQAFHRIAGLQETADTAAEPAAPVSSSHPSSPRNANSNHDAAPDADGHEHVLRKRASLPLNRKPSHRSLSSTHSRKSGISSLPRAGADPRTTEDVPPTPSSPWLQQNRAATVSSPLTSPVSPAFPSYITGVVGEIQKSSGADAELETTEEEEEGDEEEEEEDFPWGPTHPCFPHPNPHCALDSAERTRTRVIRVRRDWLAAGDLWPAYVNLYPEILDAWVGEAEFRSLISGLNALLERAFAPACWDALLSAMTGFLWEDLGLTRVKREERKVERFLDDWNRDREREGKDVKVVQLRRTGFLSLDFVVPDPGIDEPIEGEEGEQ